MTDLLHNFGIDVKLIALQAVNFFILLFLLTKFAYRPILKTLNKRKEEIRKGLLFTKQAEEKIRSIEELREETLEVAREEALKLVTRAEAEGIKRKEEIIAAAQKKVEDVVTDAKRLIQEERARSEENMRREAEMVVALAVERVIGKLPAEAKNDLLIKEALSELKPGKNEI